MAGVSKEEMAANYGWALSFLKSNKELWRLFNKAVDKNYSVNRFVAALRNTKWFRKHGEAYRQSQVLKKTDPGTYNQRLSALKAKVSDMATAMGSDMSWAQISRVATNAMWFGWSDAQLRNTISNYLDQVGHSGHYGGEAGQAEEELRKYAYDQGVNLSDSGLKTWLRNIIAQRMTTQDYKGYVQGLAQQMFPNLSDQIKAGVTVRDLAQPYIQQMAQTLEIDDASIMLTDPTIKKALQNTGPDGKFESKPLWQFDQELKQDPRWLKTNNARTQLVGAAQNVLKDWGVHF